MARKRYIPLGSSVLVKVLPPADTAGGLYLPDQAKQDTNLGRVAETGQNVRDLAVGMLVMLPLYGAGCHTIHIDGVKHYMLEEADVIAIMNEEED